MAFDGTLKFDTSIDKSGFESGLSNLGSIAKKGMAAVAGAITAATGAMAALGTKALEAYADYEQLTGGVATLFGAQDMSLEEYAQSVGKTVDAVKGEYDNLIAAQDAVMSNAAEAFRTAGMSANEYMDTVTSFSAALIASLDGDTAKAAQVADRAIVDMADNANKMGSSMESIQNAYQGFAKQNYTMLDNLKLGYGGTKSEMERLLADAEKLSGIHYNLESYADIVEAIHVIQTEMHISGISAEEAAELVASGALTEEEAFARMGTTAKEAATTIQGSVGATKAAFANLLVGIADDEQDFEKLVDNLVNSATTAAGNILPRVETIIGGIGKMISSLSGVAADLLLSLTGYIPDLVAAGSSLISAIVDGLTKNAPAISRAVTDAGVRILTGILSIAPDLIGLTGDLISALLDGLAAQLPDLVDVAFDAGLAFLEGLAGITVKLIGFGAQLIVSLSESISAHQQDIIDTAKKLITSFAESLTGNLPLILVSAVKIIGSLLDILLDPGVLSALLEAGLQIVLTLLQSLIENAPRLISFISALVSNVSEFLISAAPLLLDAVMQIIDEILNALLNPSVISSLINAGIELIMALAHSLISNASVLIGFISTLISNICKSLIAAAPILLDAAIQLFQGVLEALPLLTEELLPLIEETVIMIADLLIECSPQLLEAALTLFMAIVEALPEVIDSLTTYFGEMLSIATDWLGKIFTSALQAVKTGFTNMVTNAKQLASDLVDGAMQFLDELPGKIGHMIGEALGHIVQFAIDAPQKAKELSEEFIENVVEFFKELPGKVKEWLDSTIENVKQFAADLAQKGKDGAADLVKNVTEGVSGLPGKMLETGKNIVSGLWDGITSMGDWLKGKISSFAGGVIDGFKDAFDINSPSKVMRDSVGKYLAQGLGVGFMDEIPEIGKEALDAFSEIQLPTVSLGASLEIPEFDIPELPELTVRTAEIDAPDITLRTDKLPQIDSDAVRLLQTAREYPAAGLVQPSPTTAITNNYSYSTTNNRTDSAQPVINVHVHCETEMDGEKIAEMVAEKVDILQGETITFDERGTAH